MAVQVFISANNKSKKTYTSTRHTDHLNNHYFVGQGLTTDTHNPQIKRKSKVATFLRRRSCPVGTRGSRALHLETPFSTTLSKSPTFPLLYASSSVSSPLELNLPASSFLPRPHTRLLSREAPPPWPASFSRPTPLLGVPSLSRPIGKADTPPARQS